MSRTTAVNEVVGDYLKKNPDIAKALKENKATYEQHLKNEQAWRDGYRKFEDEYDWENATKEPWEAWNDIVKNDPSSEPAKLVAACEKTLSGSEKYASAVRDVGHKTLDTILDTYNLRYTRVENIGDYDYEDFPYSIDISDTMLSALELNTKRR